MFRGNNEPRTEPIASFGRAKRARQVRIGALTPRTPKHQIDAHFPQPATAIKDVLLHLVVYTTFVPNILGLEPSTNQEHNLSLSHADAVTSRDRLEFAKSGRYHHQPI